MRPFFQREKRTKKYFCTDNEGVHFLPSASYTNKKMQVYLWQIMDN